MKRILVALLCVVILTQTVSVASATVHETEPDFGREIFSSDKVDSLMDEYRAMSAEELNSIISNAKQQMENIDEPSPRYGFLERAWLAAAALAEPDYPCSAKLVELSVKGYDYTEDESAGLFGRKIINTTAYANWRSDFESADSVNFTKSDDSDLFYALHLADIRVAAISMYGARIEITDIFNFDAGFMEGIFATLVNDWAWLCQQTGVLNEIEVSVLFNDANWDGYTRKI